MSVGMNDSHGGARLDLPSIPHFFLSHLSPSVDLAITVFIVITGALSIVGNGVVLLVFNNRKRKLRPPELMTINLAVCDFGYSLLGAPFVIYSSYSHAWMFGEAGCVWYGVQGFVFGIGSLITTCLVSLDRCLKICSLRYGQWIERRHMAMAVGLVWLYTLSWASLPLFGFGSYGPEPYGTSCTINWWAMQSSINDKVYIYLILGLCFAVPTITIIASYMAILVTVHRSGRSVASIPSSAVTHSHRDMRLTKIAAVVCCTFLIAWTPYAIVSLYSALVKREELQGPGGMQEISTREDIGTSKGSGAGILDILNIPSFFNWSSAGNARTSYNSQFGKNGAEASHLESGPSSVFHSGSGAESHSHRTITASSLPPEVTVIPAMLAKSHCMINPLIYQIMNKEFKEDVYYMFCGSEKERERRRGRRDDSSERNPGSLSLSYSRSWRGKSTKTSSSVIEQMSIKERGEGKQREDGGSWQENGSIGWVSMNVATLDTQANLDSESRDWGRDKGRGGSTYSSVMTMSEGQFSTAHSDPHISV